LTALRHSVDIELVHAWLLALLLSAAGWEQRSFRCQRPARGCQTRACCDQSPGISSRESGGLREYLAVGEIDAPPERVFAVVTDFEHGAEFMPHLVFSRVLSRTATEVVSWASASFPLVSRRDWIVRFHLEDLPGGALRASWSPETSPWLPPPGGAVRLRVNSGSWLIEPIDGGRRSRATYQVLADPGGWIPAFLARPAEEAALPDLFEAVRKRAAVPARDQRAGNVITAPLIVPASGETR
jgi:hypothetical protein